jgi:diadenylate cyclase
VRQVLAVSIGRDEHRRAALAVVAPGTALRDGLERIVRGNTGALIVLGYDQSVRELCSGGFELSAPYSPTRLRELAKMDGAIVLDGPAGRIVRAAVQLVPDPELPTQESGTRHRTAERVARQTGLPVITVSKSMRTIAVFSGGARHVLEDSAVLLARAHQALGMLERYRRRLDDAASTLSAREIEDRATAGDVAVVAQRLEMVGRVTDEIAGYLVELGTDGGLLALQLEELTTGASRERELLLRDYGPPGDQPALAAVTGRLAALSADDLLDLAAVAAAAGLPPPPPAGPPAPPAAGLDPARSLDRPVAARGYRLLGRVPGLGEETAERVAGQFGGLQKLLSASVEDLCQAGQLDVVQARSLREGLSRLAESALLERYP